MQRRARFNPIISFPYTVNGQNVDMKFSSVAGHLMEVCLFCAAVSIEVQIGQQPICAMQVEFTEAHRKWHTCNPIELYTAPMVKRVPQASWVNTDMGGKHKGLDGGLLFKDGRVELVCVSSGLFAVPLFTGTFVLHLHNFGHLLINTAMAAPYPFAQNEI